MTTLLINSAKIANNPTTAHTRNALRLAEITDLKLVSTIEECKELNRNDFNQFVIIGAAFYPKTAEIDQWIRNGEINRVVWINNEYQVSPNSEYVRLFKDFPSLLISNIENKESNKSAKSFNDFLPINLNILLFDCKKRPVFKKYDLVYYGTYRSDRRLALQKYFNQSEYHLSSSQKNIRKFNQLAGCNAIFCDKLNWESEKETLNLFKYSLYLEDEFTHANFNYLANRFYEALMCNAVLIFDVSCRNTLEKSGYPILEKFFVSNYAELKNKVETLDWEQCLNEQFNAWHGLATLEKKDVEQCLYSVLINN